MTRQEIENYEPEKIESLDDFVAFCGYHDSDFGYQWDEERIWDKKNYRHVDTGKKILRIWIPFDKLEIFTEQVLGPNYFDEGCYPNIQLCAGSILLDDQEEIKNMIEYLGIEDIKEVFPEPETIGSYPDLSTEEKIDAYFKRLKEIGIREKNSNVIKDEEYE